MKNLSPRLNKSFIYILSINLNDGATFLNCEENRITEATTPTSIGITDITTANLNNDGGYNFVNRYITIKEKKLPMTGKTEESATF